MGNYTPDSRTCVLKIYAIDENLNSLIPWPMSVAHAKQLVLLMLKRLGVVGAEPRKRHACYSRACFTGDAHNTKRDSSLRQRKDAFR